MKCQKPIGLLTILLFALLPALASAHEEHEEDPNETTRTGWYAGLSGGWAIHLFDEDVDRRTGGLISVSDSATLAFRAGRRINKWFAAEFMYEWTEGFLARGPFDIKLFDIQGHGFTANGKAYYPFKNWAPYFLGGIGLFYTDIDDKTGTGLFADDTKTAFAGRVGVGVDLYLTKNWLLMLETTGVLTTTDLSSPTRNGLSGLHYLSQQAGIQYRF